MKQLIIFSFILFLSACKSELPEIPSDILPPDKMKVILTDMHIADVVAENRAQGGENEKDLTVQYYARIYTIHKVTKEEFVKSFKFYQNNPALYNKLYEEILTEMSKQDANVSK